MSFSGACTLAFSSSSSSSPSTSDGCSESECEERDTSLLLLLEEGEGQEESDRASRALGALLDMLVADAEESSLRVATEERVSLLEVHAVLSDSPRRSAHPASGDKNARVSVTAILTSLP